MHIFLDGRSSVVEEEDEVAERTFDEEARVGTVGRMDCWAAVRSMNRGMNLHAVFTTCARISARRSTQRRDPGWRNETDNVK
jgi:hypothetical protein